MNRVAFFLTIGVLVAAVWGGVAAAAKPIYIPIPSLEVRIDGGFKPKALSRKNPTPVTFNLSGEIKRIDGEHPPALRKLILESDRNTAIDVEGLPRCTAGKLKLTDIAGAKAACRPAILGGGRLTIQLAFPIPVPTQSKVIVLNGGVRGGVTTLYLHAYITIPVPTAIVSTVKIRKIHKGRYGLSAVATIPEIADGGGSVMDFDLTIRRRGVLTAKCTDGKLQMRAEAVFYEGTRIEGTIRRPCFRL